MDDIKQGHELSSTMKLLPPAVESHLKYNFDEMLWNLMVNAATKSHVSLEPMYSTLNPSIPTFHPEHLDNGAENEDMTYKQDTEGNYTATPNKKETYQNKMIGKFKEMCTSLVDEARQKICCGKRLLRGPPRRIIFFPTSEHQS